MSGLKLKLRPEEQILINGAVIQNGKHQTELTVKTPGARILRLRDAIHPNDANTPVKRICYVAQLAVAGEVSDQAAQADFLQGAVALQGVFRDEAILETLQEAIDFAKENNFYKAMQSARKLITHEAMLTSFFQNPEASASGKNAFSATETLAVLHEQLVKEKAEKFSGAGRNAAAERSRASASHDPSKRVNE